MAGEFLTVDDLVARIGLDKVLKYADRDMDGSLGADDLSWLDQILVEAECVVYADLLRAYPDRASVILLMATDRGSRAHAAWMACERLAQSKPEFCAADGSGPYQTQFKLAAGLFEKMGRGRKTSAAAGATGVGAGVQVGGAAHPSPPRGTADQFTFAPSRGKPGGGGGFAWPLVLFAWELARLATVG